MDNRRNKPTVVVVDDDPEWRDFVSSALAPDYAVVAVASGSEGVRTARAKRPCAIVLDVLMSGDADGFMTLCELQKEPATRAIPVVLFSNVNAETQLAFSAEEIRAHLGFGPDAFVEKPASAATIRSTVARVIEGRRGSRPAPAL